MSKNNVMLVGTVLAAAAGSLYFLVNQFKNDKNQNAKNIIDYEEVKDILSLKQYIMYLQELQDKLFTVFIQIAEYHNKICLKLAAQGASQEMIDSTLKKTLNQFAEKKVRDIKNQILKVYNFKQQQVIDSMKEYQNDLEAAEIQAQMTEDLTRALNGVLPDLSVSAETLLAISQQECFNIHGEIFQSMLDHFKICFQRLKQNGIDEISFQNEQVVDEIYKIDFNLIKEQILQNVEINDSNKVRVLKIINQKYRMESLEYVQKFECLELAYEETLKLLQSNCDEDSSLNQNLISKLKQINQ